MDGSSSAAAHRLADEIATDRDRILDAYMSALARTGSSPSGRVPDADRVRGAAGRLLAGLCEALRGDAAPAAPVHRVNPTSGSAAPEDIPHVEDLVLASTVLFETVLDWASAHLDGRPHGPRLIAGLATHLQRGIASRISVRVGDRDAYLRTLVPEARAGERQRLGRELHDRIGVGVSVAHRQLELYELYHDIDPDKAVQKARRASEAINQSMRTLREVICELHTREPFDGLDSALMEYFASAPTGDTDVRVRVTGDESRVAPHVLDELFLVLREAAHNALRHGDPATLLVNVEIAARSLRAFVEDDGCGFDTAVLAGPRRFGVASMRERMRMLGGTLRLRTLPGRGTHVDLEVPLKGGSDDDDD